MPDFEVRVGGVVVTEEGLEPHAARVPGLVRVMLRRAKVPGRAVFDDAGDAVAFMGEMIFTFRDQEVSVVGSWAERDRRVRARGDAINDEEASDADRGLLDAVEKASHVSHEEVGRLRPPASLVRGMGGQS